MIYSIESVFKCNKDYDFFSVSLQLDVDFLDINIPETFFREDVYHHERRHMLFAMPRRNRWSCLVRQRHGI